MPGGIAAAGGAIAATSPKEGVAEGARRRSYMPITGRQSGATLGVGTYCGVGGVADAYGGCDIGGGTAAGGIAGDCPYNGDGATGAC